MQDSSCCVKIKKEILRTGGYFEKTEGMGAKSPETKEKRKRPWDC